MAKHRTTSPSGSSGKRNGKHRTSIAAIANTQKEDTCPTLFLVTLDDEERIAIVGSDLPIKASVLKRNGVSWANNISVYGQRGVFWFPVSHLDSIKKIANNKGVSVVFKTIPGDDDPVSVTHGRDTKHPVASASAVEDINSAWENVVLARQKLELAHIEFQAALDRLNHRR